MPTEKSDPKHLDFVSNEVQHNVVKNCHMTRFQVFSVLTVINPLGHVKGRPRMGSFYEPLV